MATDTNTPDEKDETLEEDESEPLLDISTLAPKRPTVLVRTKDEPDGKLHELRVPSELGIIEQQELRTEGAEFAKLWNKDDLSSNGKKRLKLLLDKMFNRVFEAPEDVKGLLSDDQRQDIVVAFTTAPMQRAAAQIAEMEQETREPSTTES